MLFPTKSYIKDGLDKDELIAQMEALTEKAPFRKYCFEHQFAGYVFRRRVANTRIMGKDGASLKVKIQSQKRDQQKIILSEAYSKMVPISTGVMVIITILYALVHQSYWLILIAPCFGVLLLWGITGFTNNFLKPLKNYLLRLNKKSSDHLDLSFSNQDFISLSYC